MSSRELCTQELDQHNGGTKRGSLWEDDSASDDELMKHLQYLKRHRAATSHLYRRSACHAFEVVDWLQFMAPEIERAQSILSDRPLRINTLYSSMGGPAAALQAPATHIAKLA